MSTEGSAGTGLSAGTGNVSQSVNQGSGNPNLSSSTVQGTNAGVSSPAQNAAELSRSRSPPNSQNQNSLFEAEAEPRIYAGKYKRADELEKGYQNLLDHLQKKNPGFADPIQTQEGAPVEHDWTGFDGYAKEIELDLDYGGGQEAFNGFLEICRQEGIKPDTAKVLLKVHTDARVKDYEAYGQLNGIDFSTKEQRLAQLQREWGKDYEGTGKAAMSWARANLDPGIWGPLRTTVEGMKFLNDTRLKAADQGMITNTDAPSHEVTTDIRRKLQRIMGSEIYKNSSHPEHGRYQAAARALEMEKLKREGSI